ncbi:hypothetical protein GCM10025770_07790 [Viridibacterium curvum]|uniref:Secreted protein n=1 Tax=Viridibacterium curvum TaxID=1101404 RepID=A0ABP9QDV8_9RHOO
MVLAGIVTVVLLIVVPVAAGMPEELALEATLLEDVEDELMELATDEEDDFEELLLEVAVDEELLATLDDEALVVAVEHSFLPPAILPPKVASAQAKLPLRTL